MTSALSVNGMLCSLIGCNQPSIRVSLSVRLNGPAYDTNAVLINTSPTSLKYQRRQSAWLRNTLSHLNNVQQRVYCIVHDMLRCTATAAVPASEVEAVVWSPTNMAAAKIAAVDHRNAVEFNKMTSKWRHRRPTCGHVRWGWGSLLLANRRLQTLLLFWLDVRIEQGLTSHQTHYRSYWGRVL